MLIRVCLLKKLRYFLKVWRRVVLFLFEVGRLRKTRVVERFFACFGGRGKYFRASVNENNLFKSEWSGFCYSIIIFLVAVAFSVLIFNKYNPAGKLGTIISFWLEKFLIGTTFTNWPLTE